MTRLAPLAVCAALAAVVSCDQGRQGSLLLADDLLVSSMAMVNGEPVDLQERLCFDETWAAVPLSHGDRLVVACSWAPGSRLVLKGCGPTTEAADTSTRGELRWSVEDREETTSGRLPVGGEPGWWEKTVELPTRGGEGVVAVEAAVEPGATLWLRDAVIRRPVSGGSSRVESPQILLISVDTLRADAVARLGERIHPGFARFLAQADSWSFHYAGSSWTLPSHATMLTGVPAWVHGAVGRGFPIHESIPTLAERFRSAGLRTAATVYGTGWLKPDWGFDRGFDSYTWERWRADRLARRAVSWIHEHRDVGFFHFLHTFEPHSDFEVLPYEAPGVTRQTVERLFAVADYGCRNGRCASDLLAAINRRRIAPTAADHRVLPRLYGEGVAFTVDVLGSLFDDLRSAGLWDGLTVVVTSDHGEEFFEHGQLLHDSLHQEVLLVPLWIKWRGGRSAGVASDQPTSSVDLVPTLLELTGDRDHRLQGHPLQEAADRRAILAGDFDKAMILGRLKAIFSGEGSDRRLYDLVGDPGERTNLASERPEDVDEIHSRLVARVIEDRARWGVEGWSPVDRDRVQMTPEEEARLRALGYLE